MVRGNTSRTASTLSAIAQGDAPPPELEVARTPRSGTSLTHRLLLLMSGPNVEHARLARRRCRHALGRRADAQFLGVQAARRRQQDPLHDRAARRCHGDVVETRTFPLSEVSDHAARRRLRRRSREHDGTARHDARARSSSRFSTTRSTRRAASIRCASLRLQHARPANLAAGEVTLFDVLEQARAIRRLLSVARGADPEDLNPPERTGQGTIDLTELESARREGGERAQRRAQGVDQPDRHGSRRRRPRKLLRTRLLKLGAFGVGPAVPVSAAGEDPALDRRAGDGRARRC